MSGVVWRIANRVHLVVTDQAVTTHGILFVQVGAHVAARATTLSCCISTELRHHIYLYAVVVNKAYSVNETNNELVTSRINLHGCHVVRSLLPGNNFSLIDIPYADGLVEAA